MIDIGSRFEMHAMYRWKDKIDLAYQVVIENQILFF